MSGTTNFLPRSVNTANRPENSAAELASTIDVTTLRALAALGGERETRGTLLGVSAASALLLADLVEHVRYLGKQQEIIAKVVKKADPTTNSSAKGTVTAPAQTVGSSASANQFGAAPEVSGSTDLRITAVLEQNSLCQFGPVIAAGLNEALHTPMRELGQHAAEIANALCKAVTQQTTQLGHVIEVLRKIDCNLRFVEELRETHATQTACLAQLETKQGETVRRLDNLSQALDKMGFDVSSLVDMTATVEREAAAAEALAKAVEDTVEGDHATRGVRSQDRQPTSKKTR